METLDPWIKVAYFDFSLWRLYYGINLKHMRFLSLSVFRDLLLQITSQALAPLVLVLLKTWNFSCHAFLATTISFKFEINQSKNKRKDLPEKLVINNTTVVGKQEIAENLNKYFTNIGPNSHLKYVTNKEVLKNTYQIVTLAWITSH